MTAARPEMLRVLVVILIAVGAMAYSDINPPTEIQMRNAFDNYLAHQVAETMQFIQTTGGPSIIKKVKDSGNDRFEIRAFRKIECRQLQQEPNYSCTFSVDINLTNGIMQRTLEGRFYNSSRGLAFALVEPAL
jgi:hypothetical protein